ncbi:major facilitator superfamily domain-containing protein [Mycena crocata]|nr:major facilitator superfamily domain-containing protein [Mycena crocata]
MTLHDSHSHQSFADENRPLLSNSSTLENQPDAATRITPLPYMQMVALCSVRIVDPIAYSQIFPYINEFLLRMGVTDNPSMIGFYSGLVESSYAFSNLEANISFIDVVGRRPVVMAGTPGVAMTTLVFGLSGSLFSVIFLRGLGRIFGGNIGVFHAIVAEIADSSNQHLVYPIYDLIWRLGTIVGPLLGGLFSTLDTRFPAYFDYEFIARHPCFMPGLMSSFIALLGLISVYLVLDETHPNKRRQGISRSLEHTASRPMTFTQLLSIPIIRALALSGLLLNFIFTAFDVVFVLFCFTLIDKGVPQIGFTLAISGIISCSMQIFVLRILLCRTAPAKLCLFCMAVWPLTYTTIPLLTSIARLNPAGWWLWCGIIIVLLASRFASLAFSVILVREHAPDPSSMGSTNGLVQAAMCVSHALSPLFISSLFALSTEMNVFGGNLWVVVMVLICLGGCSLT